MFRYACLTLLITILIGRVLLEIMDLEMGNNKIFRFYSFMSPCQDVGRLKQAYWENVKIHQADNSYLIDYDFHLAVDVPDFKTEILFWRCASREALDTCVQMPVFATNAGCKFITAPNTAWTALTNCSLPVLQCPVKKGFYKFRNCQLNLKLYNFMPLGRAYWRVQITMSRKNKNLCMKCEGRIIK